MQWERHDSGRIILDEVSKQLMRGLSNLRADVREKGMLLEQMRDEPRSVHELIGDIQEQLADAPKREDFDELRADVKATKKVVGDRSRELTQLDSPVSRVEAAKGPS